jgi:hypothetical protein
MIYDQQLYNNKLFTTVRNKKEIKSWEIKLSILNQLQILFSV